MREVSVDAKVICSDGDAGRVTDVIVDPAERRVTHVVVRQNGMAAREVLVSFENVSDFAPTEVRLKCTRAQVAAFPDFTATHYVPASSPEAQPVIAEREMQMWSASDYGYGYEPLALRYSYAPDEQIPIVVDLVPTGELAFARGTEVESSDEQRVGEIAAFLVQSRDGTISHFVLRSGSLGKAHDVTLPISSIASATGYSVRLKLSRAEVELLPSVPTESKFRGTGPDALALVSIVFDTPAKAEGALRDVKAAAAQGHLAKFDAAVIRKAADGSVSSHEEHDIKAGRGALLGAVAGGVMSLVAGPVGLVGGMALGGAVGGAVGGLVDRGVPDRYVRDLGRALSAGTSALVLLVAEGSEEALLEAVKPLGGTVLRLALSDEMVASLIGSHT